MSGLTDPMRGGLVIVALFCAAGAMVAKLEMRETDGLLVERSRRMCWRLQYEAGALVA